MLVDDQFGQVRGRGQSQPTRQRDDVAHSSGTRTPCPTSIASSRPSDGNSTISRRDEAPCAAPDLPDLDVTENMRSGIQRASFSKERAILRLPKDRPAPTGRRKIEVPTRTSSDLFCRPRARHTSVAQTPDGDD